MAEKIKESNVTIWNTTPDELLLRMEEQVKPGWSVDNDAFVWALTKLTELKYGDMPVRVTQAFEKPYTTALTMDFMGAEHADALFRTAHKAFIAARKDDEIYIKDAE